MNDNQKRGYIIIAVVFVVFSVISFAAPFEMTAAFWMAYLFGAAAAAFQIYLYSVVLSDMKDAKSRFYSFPIARIGIIYLSVQLFISLLEMILSDDIPVWAVLIINIIVAAAAVIGCMGAQTAKEEIVRQETVVKKDTAAMKEIRSLAAALAQKCEDNSVKAELEQISDKLSYSDPVSSERTREIEGQILEGLEELRKSLSSMDAEGVRKVCKRIDADVDERNRLCSLGKGL